MDHIVNNLWLGSQRDADDLVDDNPENITAILNVRGPDAYRPAGRDQSAEHPGKTYKWIPAPDIGRVSPEHVQEATAWLQEQTNQGRRILIHCMHGISRSPAFLAAFMVKRGLAPTLDEAKAAILRHRAVQPASQMVEYTAPVVLISALTGLPNREAFHRNPPSPFVAALNVRFMKVFNDSFGQIAGDVLLRRLGQILLLAGLDAYHTGGDEFLCKGASREELSGKLRRALRSFEEPFRVYAEGRFQTIEGADFSSGIGATIEEAETSLQTARKEKAADSSPEWLRKIISTAGYGQPW
jgi:GGDEF domain-containing protein